MSDFHGGYYVRLPEPDLAALQRVARTFLLGTADEDGFLADRAHIERCGLAVTLAQNSDVLLITLDGPFTEGKEACYWHQDEANHGFALRLSRELSVRCYTYSYEDRVGAESLHVQQDGVQTHEDHVAWDEALKDGRGRDDWPLSRLATALGVSREEIELRLYPGKRLELPLDEGSDLKALGRQLVDLRAEARRTGPARPAPDESSFARRERQAVEDDERERRESAQHAAADEDWERQAREKQRRSAERTVKVLTALVACFVAIPGGLGMALVLDAVATTIRDDDVAWLAAVLVVGLFVACYVLLRRWQTRARRSDGSP